MQISLQIVDECIGASSQQRRRIGPRLTLVSETLTAREILAERIKTEWSTVHELHTERIATREELNSWMHEITNVSSETSQQTAIDRGVTAFRRREFLFFWNDGQVVSLDERLLVKNTNEALFFRLLPLKGG